MRRKTRRGRRRRKRGKESWRVRPAQGAKQFRYTACPGRYVKDIYMRARETAGYKKDDEEEGDRCVGRMRRRRRWKRRISRVSRGRLSYGARSSVSDLCPPPPPPSSASPPPPDPAYKYIYILSIPPLLSSSHLIFFSSSSYSSSSCQRTCLSYRQQFVESNEHNVSQKWTCPSFVVPDQETRNKIVYPSLLSKLSPFWSRLISGS